jgi:hypothetical protein
MPYIGVIADKAGRCRVVNRAVRSPFQLIPYERDQVGPLKKGADDVTAR